MVSIPLDFIKDENGDSPVAVRIAAFLRLQGTAKQVARQLTPPPAIKTVEKWRLGARPSMKHFEAMIDAWGVAFLASVFAPVMDADRTANDRLNLIEAEIALLRKELTHEDPADHEDTIKTHHGSVAHMDRGAERRRRTVVAGTRKIILSLLIILSIAAPVSTSFASFLDGDASQPMRTVRPMRTGRSLRTGGPLKTARGNRTTRSIKTSRSVRHVRTSQTRKGQE